MAGTKTAIIEGSNRPPILDHNVGGVFVRVKNCNNIAQVTAVF